MKLLEKLEILLNALLFKLAEFIAKYIPVAIKKKYAFMQSLQQRFTIFLKTLPSLLKTKAIALIKNVKTLGLGFNYKAAFQESYQKAMSQYKEKSPHKKIGMLKTLFLTPCLVVGQWLNGLTTGQSFLLLTFSAGSFLAVFGIFFSGQRLMNSHSDAFRAPASVEEEIAYERPGYYKKQTKHFKLVNVLLPVYVAKVNEIRSVNIDFTATLTNRYSRMFLEKHEFHLRDHIILQLEPSVAAFPLEEEGKIIIRDKLLREINDFLKLNEVEGEVVELKITDVLAN